MYIKSLSLNPFPVTNLRADVESLTELTERAQTLLSGLKYTAFNRLRVLLNVSGNTSILSALTNRTRLIVILVARFPSRVRTLR